MRLRTFEAKTMQEAMEAIRRAMGEEAVILSTTNLGNGRGVTVTVAIDEEAEDERIVAFEPEPEFIPEPLGKRDGVAPRSVDAERQQQLRELEQLLRFHGVPMPVLEKMIESARFLPLPPGLNFGGIKKALAQLCDAFFQFSPLTLEEDHRIMLVGPPAMGKTTTLVKLATRLKLDGKRFHVITTDTSRAGGVEQLKSLTDILGVPLHIADSKDSLRAVLKELPPVDCTLIDSAGANPYDTRELHELGGLLGIGGIEPVLVLAAGMDAAESDYAARSFRLIAPLKRLLATRTDVARRYGSLMAASHAVGLSLAHASGSARVTADFITLNAEVWSGMLMQHRLTAKDQPGDAR